MSSSRSTASCSWSACVTGSSFRQNLCLLAVCFLSSVITTEAGSLAAALGHATVKRQPYTETEHWLGEDPFAVQDPRRIHPIWHPDHNHPRYKPESLRPKRFDIKAPPASKYVAEKKAPNVEESPGRAGTLLNGERAKIRSHKKKDQKKRQANVQAMADFMGKAYMYHAESFGAKEKFRGRRLLRERFA
ncbi:hypothetical protein CYMTET_14541 [Cymbomonas tetramitiformis]|uniref:Uncharacterized protein n=1 Tax=Cymbomonas tetramitiformis TaxID=36881 RepID=A0AAE0GGE5_9CHLO|nr:hypothetical protein CYMTET_14541 [Cymbomonas tetramitiformis]